MHPSAQHVPGAPESGEPPEALVHLAETISHPLVHRTGITATAEGRWALYVTVSKQTEVPLCDLESRCEGFPVVYEAEPDEPLQPFRP